MADGALAVLRMLENLSRMSPTQRNATLNRAQELAGKVKPRQHEPITPTMRKVIKHKQRKVAAP